MNEQQRLLAHIVNFLLERQYAPEERVPSERELAVRFDVSRGQVREALSALEALRVVERRPKSGIYMTNGSASIEALSLFAQIGVPLSRREVEQIVEVRSIHEVAAIRLAAVRRTEEDIASMRAILEKSAAGFDDGAATADLDRLFHSAISRATQNDALFRITNIFYLMTEKRRAFYFQNPQRCKQSHQEHQALLDTVVAQDPDAAVAALERHLQGMDSYWRDLIAAGEGPEEA